MINIGSELDDSGLEAGGVVRLQEKKYRVSENRKQEPKAYRLGSCLFNYVCINVCIGFFKVVRSRGLEPPCPCEH